MKTCTNCDRNAPVALRIAATDADGTVLDIAEFCVDCARDQRKALDSLNLAIGDLRP